MAISKFANLSINSSTSKTEQKIKTGKQYVDKIRLNETKTKLKRKDRSVLKITFKILHNITLLFCYAF